MPPQIHEVQLGFALELDLQDFNDEINFFLS